MEAIPPFIGLIKTSTIGQTGTHVPGCVLSERGPWYMVSYVHFIPFIKIQMLSYQIPYVKVWDFIF